MIPQHLIDKAAQAAADAPYDGERPAHVPLDKMHSTDAQGWRDAARAAIEAVAADIWDEAHEAGFKYGCDIGGDVVWEPEYTPNPYRASENAWATNPPTCPRCASAERPEPTRSPWTPTRRNPTSCTGSSPCTSPPNGRTDVADDYRLCPHGFHHPPWRHSCDGCWCEGERDRREYGWNHNTDPHAQETA